MTKLEKKFDKEFTSRKLIKAARIMKKANKIQARIDKLTA